MNAAADAAYRTITMRINFLVALMCLVCSVCGAQDFAAELQRMSEAYMRIQNLHAEVEVSVFETLTSKNPYLVKQTAVKKKGSEYVCKMDGITLLLNEKLTLMVHDTEKQIVVSERDEKQEKKIRQATGAPGLDLLIKENDSIRYNGITGSLKHYTLHTGKGPVKYAEVYIDKDTGFLNKVVYYYDTVLFPMSAMVVVNYKTFELAPQFTEHEFSEQQYIKFSGKSITAAGRYAGYDVLKYDGEKF